MSFAHSDSFDLDAYFEVELAYTEYNARRVLRADSPALEVRRCGEVLGVRDSNRPDGYYNRVFGPIGLATPGVEEMLAWVAEAGGRSVVEALVAPGETAEAQLGWRLESEKTVLELPEGRELVGPQAGEHSVRRATRDDLERIFELWQDGAPLAIEGAELERTKPAQLDARFPIFVLEIAGQVAAMGTSFLSHGQAWLGNANTDRRYRRMGAHSALVAHRVAHARASGARAILVDLEPGGASHESVLRSGFEPLLGLHVYARDSP